METLNPIHSKAALEIQDVIVVADLHLGIEEELKRHGINLPHQTDALARELVELCFESNKKKLIILGDVKHAIPWQTSHVRRFFAKIFEMAPELRVGIIPGNHDGNLELDIEERIQIYSNRGMTLNSVGLFHGHMYPSEEVTRCQTLVTGHEHPCLKLGEGIFERCWLRVPFSKKGEKWKDGKGEVVIMPAFNELCGCNSLSLSHEHYLSPLIKRDFLDLEKGIIYLLDGVSLPLREVIDAPRS